jgi:hypothetical protein
MIFLGLLVFSVLYFGLTPAGRQEWNEHFYKVQKVDDTTSYQTKKRVEDSCRAMIASYESDKLTYEQYKDSESTEKRTWAEQAKMRANKTVSSYNNYVLKNSFVWDENIPDDIQSKLEYIT